MSALDESLTDIASQRRLWKVDRLSEILNKKNQSLRDGETIIYVKNNEMIALHHDGKGLSQVSGKVNDKLKDFLRWLADENQY